MTRRRSNATLFERLKGPSSVSYRGELQRRRAEAKRRAAADVRRAKADERKQLMREREAEREAIRREREQIRTANKLKRRLLAEEEAERRTAAKERAREREERALPSAAAIERAYKQGASTLTEAMEMARRGNPKGSKGKFQRCVESVAARGGAYDPRAVCGAIEKRLKENPVDYNQIHVASKSKAAGLAQKKLASGYRWAEVQKERSGRNKGKYRVEYGTSPYMEAGLRGNPADSAASAYRDFHGRDPQESITVSRQVHFHKHLAAAGDLRRLDGRTVEGGKFSLKWGKGDKPVLAFNEERNQLFIEGGEQSVDLPAFGIKRPHELETLGKVTGIDYFTRKDHLGSEGGTAIYRHKFRTINQDGKPVTVKILRYPDLIYRVRDQHLEFSGGSYEIKPEGIDK